MNGAYGEGMVAFEMLQQWADAVWPVAVGILAFMAGYIVGGIVQRVAMDGQGMSNRAVYITIALQVVVVISMGMLLS